MSTGRASPKSGCNFLADCRVQGFRGFVFACVQVEPLSQPAT